MSELGSYDTDSGLFQGLAVLADDFDKVGADLRAATFEVAQIIGGETLQRDVESNLINGIWPRPDQLRQWETLHPGITVLILDRAHEIQSERFFRERAELWKPRNIFKAMLRGRQHHDH